MSHVSMHKELRANSWFQDTKTLSSRLFISQHSRRIQKWMLIPIYIYEGFHKWGYPKMDRLYGKSHSNGWFRGTHILGTPPYQMLRIKHKKSGSQHKTENIRIAECQQCWISHHSPFRLPPDFAQACDDLLRSRLRWAPHRRWETPPWAPGFWTRTSQRWMGSPGQWKKKMGSSLIADELTLRGKS